MTLNSRVSQCERAATNMHFKHVIHLFHFPFDFTLDFVCIWIASKPTPVQLVRINSICVPFTTNLNHCHAVFTFLFQNIAFISLCSLCFLLENDMSLVHVLILSPLLLQSVLTSIMNVSFSFEMLPEIRPQFQLGSNQQKWIKKGEKKTRIKRRVGKRRKKCLRLDLSYKQTNIPIGLIIRSFVQGETIVFEVLPHYRVSWWTPVTSIKPIVVKYRIKMEDDFV